VTLPSFSASYLSGSVNLRIVLICLSALLKYSEMQTDADSASLLVSITDFHFVFALSFLSEVFMLANASSEALQANGVGLCGVVGVVGIAHSLSDPQVVSSNPSTAYFHTIIISLKQAEITGVVLTGHDSLRCML